MKFPYLRMMSRYFQDKRSLAICFITSLFVNILSTMVIYQFKGIVDTDIPAKNLNAILLRSLAILLMMMVSLRSNMLFTASTKRVEADALYLIRQDVFRHLLRTQYSHFVRRNFGMVNTNVVQDVEDLGKCIFVRLAGSVANIFYFAITFGILLFVNPLLTSILIAFIVFFTFYVGKLKEVMIKNAEIYTESRTKLNTILIDFIANTKSSLLYNLQEQKIESVAKCNARMNKNWLKLNVFSPLIQSSIESAILISYLLMFGFGMLFLRNNTLTYGELVLYITFIPQLWDKYASVIDVYNGFVQGEVYAKRIFAPLSEETEENTGEYTYSTRSIQGIKENGILIYHLCFSFDNSYAVFDGFTAFFSRPGLCCINGPSGCGKSTLFDLILGLYTPQDGQIVIDGAPVEHYGLQKLRETVGIVHQDAYFINGSILENIRFFSSRLSDDDVYNFVKRMGLMPYFMRLPISLSQPINRNDRVLTYGHKRIISILRALIRDPPYLLLDEITAALDSHTELLTLKIIQEEAKRKGCIMISHKESDEHIADKQLTINR